MRKNRLSKFKINSPKSINENGVGEAIKYFADIIKESNTIIGVLKHISKNHNVSTRIEHHDDGINIHVDVEPEDHEKLLSDKQFIKLVKDYYDEDDLKFTLENTDMFSMGI